MPSTMKQGIWIENYFNNKQVKVGYSDVSAIKMFAIQIPQYSDPHSFQVMVRITDHSVGLLSTIWIPLVVDPQCSVGTTSRR